MTVSGNGRYWCVPLRLTCSCSVASAIACRIDAATGNDEVCMRVIRQVTSPGVQDAQKPCLLHAHVSIVRCRRLQRLRCRTQQRRIRLTRMRQYGFTHFLRHGEGDQEVVTRQQAILLSFEPPLCPLVLARRAMAIATRTRQRVLKPATGTAISNRAERVFPTRSEISRCGRVRCLEIRIALRVFQSLGSVMR